MCRINEINTKKIRLNFQMEFVEGVSQVNGSLDIFAVANVSRFPPDPPLYIGVSITYRDGVRAKSSCRHRRTNGQKRIQFSLPGRREVLSGSRKSDISSFDLRPLREH